MLYSEFQKNSHMSSHNFTQFSCNLGYFSHFWANFIMLGIKKHVLQPRNSLVILSQNFRHVFMQISRNFNTIWTISAIFGQISICWVSNSMYSSLEIHWWYFHAISCILGYFSLFGPNFNMLGIKMHVLELRNSLVILSRNFLHPFTQFHAIFMQFWLFQSFLGQFQHVGY